MVVSLGEPTGSLTFRLRVMVTNTSTVDMTP